MARVFVFSLTSLCLALVAVVGLGAYSAAHLPRAAVLVGAGSGGGLGDTGAVMRYRPPTGNSRVRLMSVGVRSEPRPGVCAARGKLRG